MRGRAAARRLHHRPGSELNKSLFSALKLEKNILFLTIALIVIVAALNIIATLILMVMEKTRDIGILMAMGATPAMIRRIFFLQGALIGVVGTVLGAGLGLGLVLPWPTPSSSSASPSTSTRSPTSPSRCSRSTWPRSSA